jgi:hypothetical protein
MMHNIRILATIRTKMNTIQYIIACLTLCVAQSIANAQILFDMDLEQALQGAWCNSKDQGKTCWGFDVFNKGKTDYCGRLPSSGEVVYGSTSYTVRGNRVCHIITSSNDENFLSVGETLCFDVLRIDTERQVFRSVEDNELDTLYRTQAEGVRCPKAGI